MTIRIRPANRADLPRLTEIYNHYVIHTPVTFDIEPYTVERRGAWFDQFALIGRYRLMVAEEDGLVLRVMPGLRASAPKQRMTLRWRPRSIAAMKGWAKELAGSFMPDCWKSWPVKTLIALWAVTRCRMMVQRSCMNSLGLRMWAFSPRSVTSSENTGTCSGRNVRYGCLDNRKDRRLLSSYHRGRRRSTELRNF
jgi:hypothetical protein